MKITPDNSAAHQVVTLTLGNTNKRLFDLAQESRDVSEDLSAAAAYAVRVIGKHLVDTKDAELGAEDLQRALEALDDAAGCLNGALARYYNGPRFGPAKRPPAYIDESGDGLYRLVSIGYHEPANGRPGLFVNVAARKRDHLRLDGAAEYACQRAEENRYNPQGDGRTGEILECGPGKFTRGFWFYERL